MKIKITLILFLFFPLLIFGQWSSVTSFPSSGRTYPYCFTIAGKAYLGSGFNSSSNATVDHYEYNPITNNWTTKQVPPFSARMGAFSFSIGNYGYIGSGSTNGGANNLNDFWRYDPVTDTWVQMANFPGVGRVEAAAMVINGKAYIVSGVSSSGAPSDCWEYNPVMNTWTAKSNPPAGFTPGYVTGFTYGNNAYVGIGGFNSSSNNDFWKYDPVLNSWTQLASLPSAPQTRTWTISGADLIAGKGFVGLGGFSSASNADFWMYDFGSDTWQTTTSSYNHAIGLASGRSFQLFGETYIGIGAKIGGGIDNTIYKYSCLSIPSNLQTGLLAYYPFNGGSLADYSGNGHNLVNTTTAISASDRNNNANCAFEFDNIPNTNNEFLKGTNTIFLNGLTELSVSCWYQPLDVSRNPGSYEGLISRDQALSCPDRMGQWSLSLYDCRRAVFSRENSVWDIPNGSCDVTINTNVWHHLTATYNQVGNTIKLYKDGVLQDTATGVAACGTVSPFTMDIGDLFIGKLYTGRIDDIFIHNRELSVTEINQLYTLGSSCCPTAVLSVIDHPEIMNSKKMKLYPNPSDSFITIEIADTIKSVLLYELNGREVINQNGTDKKLDISSLNSGIYIVKVNTNNATYIDKIIKK
ncbi:kelch repeat-containing protein [Flavobacterium sp. '19STA2R22 D10 B1']|uniref:Kelch repeat-containing protein n=1 Tax=Flavobacterium aerium TaxID=3037261 RepID=UPI00278C0810|nr:kelch repeat-containing protein [Flavobacterium sp. '19STA2R22 D10 B1']